MATQARRRGETDSIEGYTLFAIRRGAQSMIIGLAFHVLAAVIWVAVCSSRTLCCGPRRPLRACHPPAALASRLLALLFLGLAQHRGPFVSGFADGIPGFGGFATVGAYIRAMMALGIVMIVIYTILFRTLAALRRAVLTTDWSAAKRASDRSACWLASISSSVW